MYFAERCAHQSKVLLAAVALLLMTTLAAGESRAGDETPKISYELYSWQLPGGEWQFSLLPNTSSEKHLVQILSRKAKIGSIARLRRKLASLPKGTTIYWVGRVPSGSGPKEKGSEMLTIPPSDLRDQIRKFAMNHHINLED
jgi:hypothetical protein